MCPSYNFKHLLLQPVSYMCLSLLCIILQPKNGRFQSGFSLVWLEICTKSSPSSFCSRRVWFWDHSSHTSSSRRSTASYTCPETVYIHRKGAIFSDNSGAYAPEFSQASVRDLPHGRMYRYNPNREAPLRSKPCHNRSAWAGRCTDLRDPGQRTGWDNPYINKYK